ncbi:MAG: M14 family metallopeptidase, partial [Longimicrobiales bacterium]|nr:M14 family metallopeptidase [Longimicrobiales bacterium]
PAGVAAQEPRTRAERTDWLETSRYEDVQRFIEAVAGSPLLHAGTFGYSYEGRPLPLVVVGADLVDGSPESVEATGRTRVLVLANIHAGEVEGKEASQILLRRLAAGQHGEWLDSLVVLVAPIYNADGNERVSVSNRYRQNGPLGGVGERANAQGLDLNRDHTKLETPEARSLVQLMNAYDPHLVVDLHTTNGTYHGYRLTYAPPLHPNTAGGLIELLRERWLPEVTAAIAREYGWPMYYYGNAYAPAGGERGWYTYDHRPRYNSNYVGLRNRFGILSEGYAYADFEERALATLAFVEQILTFAHAHATELDRRVAEADLAAADLPGRRLALRAEHEPGPVVEILMGAVEERLSPYSGRRYRARLDVARPERMREYGTFRAMETGVVPDAYYVPAELGAVLDLLRLHGVRTATLPGEQTVVAERFRVDSTRAEPREFQGHRQREVFGAWERAEATLPEGTVVVPMDQSLARLVFALLEPRSDDGVVNWNLVDAALAEGRYPILRRPAR